MNLFSTTSRSLILRSVESIKQHREVLVTILRLKHLLQSQLNDDKSKEIVEILLKYKELAYTV